MDSTLLTVTNTITMDEREKAEILSTSGLSMRTKVKALSRAPGVTYADFVKYLPYFCHNVDVPGLGMNGTAFLLSHAHGTAFSAQCILALVKKQFNVEMLPEKIWDIHRKWARHREFRPFPGDTGIFDLCLEANETTPCRHRPAIVLLNVEGWLRFKEEVRKITTPLTSTVSVAFVENSKYFQSSEVPLINFWGKAPNGQDMYPQILELLEWRDDEAMSLPTSLEKKVLKPLGRRMLKLLFPILSAGNKALIATLRNLDINSPFAFKERLILETSRAIAQEFLFKMMMRCQITWGFCVEQHRVAESYKGDPSTIDGACTLLYGLIFCRGMEYLHHRFFAKQIIEFIPTDITTLAPDHRDCPICLVNFQYPRADQADKLLWPGHLQALRAESLSYAGHFEGVVDLSVL